MFVDLPLLKLENSTILFIIVKEVSQLLVDGVRIVEWYLKVLEIGVLILLVILLPFNVVVEIRSKDGVRRGHKCFLEDQSILESFILSKFGHRLGRFSRI